MGNVPLARPTELSLSINVVVTPKHQPWESEGDRGTIGSEAILSLPSTLDCCLEIRLFASHLVEEVEML